MTDTNPRVGRRSELRAVIKSLCGLEKELRDHLTPGQQRRLEEATRMLQTHSLDALSAEEFRDIRRQAGFSQETLARELNRTVRQVARYESGRTPIPFGIARRMAALRKDKGPGERKEAARHADPH